MQAMEFPVFILFGENAAELAANVRSLDFDLREWKG